MYVGKSREGLVPRGPLFTEPHRLDIESQLNLLAQAQLSRDPAHFT
jgi:hypothetical protein